MQKIVPHLWFDTQVKEAAALYTSLFPNSKVVNTTTITDTPSGDCDIVTFELANQTFMGISAGPYFTFNPAISFFVVFETEADIEAAWKTLSQDGKVLMPYNTYPWAQKYGWCKDRFGLSWQLSLSEHHDWEQKITPMMMFTQQGAGRAQEAMAFYTSIFPDSHTDVVVKYEAGEGDSVDFVKHGRFTLAGQQFMAMDSSLQHDFVFNEAVSLIVNCETQEEIDRYWEKLSVVPEAEQCGWCKDRFGVSWQIVPTAMNEMMEKGTPEQKARVTKAFLAMKKFNIAELEKAFVG